MIKLKELFNVLRKDDVTESFLKRIGNAKIIVFENEDRDFSDFNIPDIFSTPFQSQWVEMSENIELFRNVDGKQIGFSLLGLLIEEVGPNEYIVFSSHKITKIDDNIVGLGPYTMTSFKIIDGELRGVQRGQDETFFKFCLSEIKDVMNEINKNPEYGITKHIDRIKSGRVPYALKEVSDVIHIRRKKNNEKISYKFSGKKIDWAHRWSVRGHWRKFSGKGKNRSGEYIIDGFTWVMEHTKGPDDAPLVEKTRIFHA